MFFIFVVAALAVTPHPSSTATTPSPAGTEHAARRAQLGGRGTVRGPVVRKKRSRSPKHAVSQRGELFAILAARHAMLHDFLVETATETPAFVDRHVFDAGGVRIGPTSVDIDFLGDAVVRATVLNPSAREMDVILRADVEDATGHRAHASTWVQLRPGASRAIEVLAPGLRGAASVRWSATDLGAD